MKKKRLFIIITIIFVSGLSFSFFSNRLQVRYLPSEKLVYKKSDIGSDVYQLTTNQGEDNIYYQEPNYFSPDSSKFLFKSNRARRQGLYLVDLDSGDITLLYRGMTGHVPTWSNDGTEVYFGQLGKIVAINVDTFKGRNIDIPGFNWITFIHTNPSGRKLVFVEEGINIHKKLSVINSDGEDYQSIYVLDHEIEYYLDHPIFVDDNTILFLTRGENRNFEDDFNKPYILNLDGNIKRLPIECSHYDVHPDGNKILCASEGYIIDLQGNILKEIEVNGHGVWHPDGKKYLMTMDPLAAEEENPYRGKITIYDYNTNRSYDLVSHESTYNSTLEIHIQPNAQFSHDGRYVIYESDRGKKVNSNLFIVEVLD